MAQEFDENIFALASVVRTRDHATMQPKRYIKPKSELGSLDLLALLLVSEDKGDVAAIAMNRSPTAVTIY